MGRKSWELGEALGNTNSYPRLKQEDGAGIKLFDGADFAVRRLESTGHQVYNSGVAVLTYRKA